MDEVNIDARRLYHVLTHFVGISVAERRMLMDAGYGVDEIEAMFRRPGSKFLPDFALGVAEAVRRVLDRSGRGAENVPVDADGRRRISAVFGHAVGTVSILHEGELTGMQRSRVAEIRRGGALVRCVPPSGSPILTCEAHLVVDASDNSLVTVFPGPDAPPLPTGGWMSDPFWREWFFVL